MRGKNEQLKHAVEKVSVYSDEFGEIGHGVPVGYWFKVNVFKKTPPISEEWWHDIDNRVTLLSRLHCVIKEKFNAKMVRISFIPFNAHLR